MEPLHQPPVFCDNCPTLALAVLDIAPLCEKCLIAAVNQAEDRSILDQIKPLVLKPRLHLGTTF